MALVVAQPTSHLTLVLAPDPWDRQVLAWMAMLGDRNRM